MNNPPFENGVTIRASRIFNEKSGRCVAIALDHGSSLGAVTGLENIGERFEQVIAGKPDAVLLAPGTIRRFGQLLMGKNAPTAVLAVDYPLFSAYPGGEKIDGHVPTISVQEASRLGADMVKIVMIFGREKMDLQFQNFSFISRTIEECHKIGMPVMVEPTTWGLRFNGANVKDAKLLADMARMAYEAGADIVKSDFPGTGREMEMIAAACPVPIVLLGGGKTESIETMLSEVLACVQNGAAGVTFGRNVWQHPDPPKIIKALQKVVHEEDLSAALDVLRAKVVNL